MKYITDIDNASNLKAIVVQDLKEIGIKVPKVKKSKSKEETLNIHNDSVFGNHLTLVPSVFMEDYGPVAKFLVDATRHLEKHITVEGLFRKSGSVARQKELRMKYEGGHDLNDANPIDVASLIKQFFRELPDPLLISRYHETFLKCHGLEPESMRVFALLHLCHILPLPHVSTLRFIMTFLQTVAANSDCNKMDATNLAVCLAPNLMSSCGPKADPRHIQMQTSIVQLLLAQANNIGMVDDALFERTCLLGACYPSEEELYDSSVSCQDESRTKKKKKRRSGSLQGMINNLSSSFTKWRKDGPGSKHNMSNVSDKSTMSALSYLSFDRHSVTMSIPGLGDQGDNMIGLTPEGDAVHDDRVYVVEDVSTEATPKVMRKRKLEEESVPFSASKRKAILQGMPHMSTLGGTPFTPQILKAHRAAADFQDTPNIKFADHTSDVIFCATPTPRRMGGEKLFSPNVSASKVKRTPSGKSGCFTPKGNKSGVRQSVRGFLRRLSGSKDPNDSSQAEDSQFGPSDSVISTNDSSVSKKKGGLFRRKKTPSSPARLVTQLYNEHKQLQQQEGFNISCSEVDASPMLHVSTTSSHQRSYSAGGGMLKRGKPNTVKTGLPSPCSRRSIDSCPVEDNPSALDTSPIPREEREMSRQGSRSSLGSTDGEGGNDFDHAFIQESMLNIDDEEDEVPMRMPSPVGQNSTLKGDGSSAVIVMDGCYKGRLFSQKSQDSVDSAIEPDMAQACSAASSVQDLTRSQSLQSVDSGTTDAKEKDALPVVDSPVVDSPVVDSPVVDSPVVDSPAVLVVDQADLDSRHEKEIAERRASPLRFPNSTSRKNHHISPIHIPSIFSRADEEVVKCIGSQQRVRVPSPIMRTGSTRKAPHLPISTKLVRSSAVESARQRLNSESESQPQTEAVTPENPVKMQEDAGHTPRPPVQSALHAVEISGKAPLHDSSNNSPRGLRFKSQLMTSDLTLRVKGCTPSVSRGQRYRSPVKPVKRLHGSPKSPKSVHRSPGKPPGRADRLSPLPAHVLDWNI